MVRTSGTAFLAENIASLGHDEEDELEAERDALWEHWRTSPSWEWLTGKDLDGTPIIRTINRHADPPVQPFPTTEYLRHWINLLDANEPITRDGKLIRSGVVILEKCRQMFASWSTLAWADRRCRFNPWERIILCKTTEDEAKAMLKDKVRALHMSLPAWIQARSPVSESPLDRVDYPATNSYILAANEKVAQTVARGSDATAMIVDEGAFHNDLLGTVGASLPMVGRLILITTPYFGTPSANAYKAMLERED